MVYNIYFGRVVFQIATAERANVVCACLGFCFVATIIVVTTL